MINIHTIELCKDTYETIIQKQELSKEEKEFIKQLHKVVFEYIENDFEKMVNDITELSTYKIKVKK